MPAPEPSDSELDSVSIRAGTAAESSSSGSCSSDQGIQSECALIIKYDYQNYHACSSELVIIREPSRMTSSNILQTTKSIASPTRVDGVCPLPPPPLQTRSIAPPNGKARHRYVLGSVNSHPSLAPCIILAALTCHRRIAKHTRHSV